MLQVQDTAGSEMYGGAGGEEGECVSRNLVGVVFLAKTVFYCINIALEISHASQNSKSS